MNLALDPETVKGFLHPDEGRRLYELAASVGAVGPCLEVGSYCGKSTIYIGSACRETDNLVYAVDHHRGSEEHQLGEAYHDPDLYDAEQGCMDSFRTFRRSMALAGLEDVVVPIVASSEVAGKRWGTPLGLVFIDGGHSQRAADIDLETWMPHVGHGGFLAVHDIFFSLEDGGQAPRLIYERALATGDFEAMPMTRTLGVLRRTG